MIDREIAQQLYDPGKLSWQEFVKAHSNWRTPEGLIDLKRISVHWKEYQKGKAYDPAKRPPKRWFYAMLKGIKSRSDVRNPQAVVASIWHRLSPGKQADIKKREVSGERFKYDLPLPEDKATRGTGTLRMVKPFKLAEVQVNLSLKDYIAALKSGLFSKMKRGDGTTALVARCKSPEKNVNVFVDKV